MIAATTLGRIGEHHVLIACLPAGTTGIGAAATVATSMKRSFSIKFRLMVGVGSGVWNPEADVHLGDIVVSKPTELHGGVVLEKTPMAPGKLEYAALQKEEIRVIILLPALSRTRDICCNLETMPFSCKVAYEALSYNWIKGKDTWPVKFGSSTVLAGENHFLALAHLRHRVNKQMLWIDALCINQEDLTERARKSSSAYARYLYKSNAGFSMLGWANDSDRAYKAIKEFGKRHTDVNMSIIKSMNSDRQARGFVAPGERWARPYWTRIWIRQEVALGQNVIVHCGGQNFEWEKFCNAAAFVKNNYGILKENGGRRGENELLRPILKYYNAIFPLEAIRQRRMEGQVITLLSLLLENCDAGATDEKDMVYALLGLATNPKAVGMIKPDYTPTTRIYRLFLHVMRYLVENEPSVDLLRLCHNGDQDGSRPSWVIDWRQYATRSTFLNFEYKSRRFNASGEDLVLWEKQCGDSHNGSPSLGLRLCQDESSQKVLGVCFDQILALGEAFLDFLRHDLSRANFGNEKLRYCGNS